MVQHPDDASWSDMPKNALMNVTVDFVGTTHEIANCLKRFSKRQTHVNKISCQ